MAERRNDPEIMKDHAIACGIQLGSISSLRCQKSRRRHPSGRCLQSDVSRTKVCWPCFFQQAIVSIKPSGGARRDRTDDLMLAKHALSQLSYGPVPEDECFKLNESHMHSIKVVGLGRLELPTSRLSSARSNQLSYKPQRSLSPTNDHLGAGQQLATQPGVTRPMQSHKRKAPGACSSAKKEKRRRRNPANAAQRS